MGNNKKKLNNKVYQSSPGISPDRLPNAMWSALSTYI